MQYSRSSPGAQPASVSLHCFQRLIPFTASVGSRRTGISIINRSFKRDTAPHFSCLIFKTAHTVTWARPRQITFFAQPWAGKVPKRFASRNKPLYVAHGTLQTCPLRTGHHHQHPSKIIIFIIITISPSQLLLPRHTLMPVPKITIVLITMRIQGNHISLLLSVTGQSHAVLFHNFLHSYSDLCSKHHTQLVIGITPHALRHSYATTTLLAIYTTRPL